MSPLPGNFGKIDALRLILRHSGGTSSHSVEFLGGGGGGGEQLWGGYPRSPPPYEPQHV